MRQALFEKPLFWSFRLCTLHKRLAALKNFDCMNYNPFLFFQQRFTTIYLPSKDLILLLSSGLFELYFAFFQLLL